MGRANLPLIAITATTLAFATTTHAFAAAGLAFPDSAFAAAVSTIATLRVAHAACATHTNPALADTAGFVLAIG